MKALSVRQPWAHLIANGEKTIEVRSWQTDYRGKLLICTSLAEKNSFFNVSKEVGGKENEVLVMPYGVMYCYVDLVDVRKLRMSDFEAAVLENGFDFRNQYAWVLENPVPVRFNKVYGKLRLFEVEDELIVPVLTTNDWLKQVREFEPQAKPTKRSQIW